MTGYSLFGYGAMIRDEIRTHAYAEAIERAVKPGSVVLDIGTGTGVLALLAAQAGARKVIAVEPSELIEVARETAKANGASDTIDFVHGLSTSLELEQPVDVIVCDLHGALPLYSMAIPSIVDARSRLLAPGGVIIPRREWLWAMPVESPTEYDEHVASWNGRPYGLDLSAARPLAANSRWGTAGSAHGLSAAEQLATLDYAVIESSNISSSSGWTAEKAGSFHGFLVWFDSELHPGIGFTNAPEAPTTIYGQTFFPVQEPVDIAAGDELSLTFQATLFGDEYVFRWDTRVADGKKASFAQSTLFSFPLTPERLARVDETYAPVATDAGKALGFFLTHAGGGLTLSQLAAQLRAEFPREFRSTEDAEHFASVQATKYCR